MTVIVESRLTTVAPIASSRATSSAMPAGARRSKCSRFFAVFGSGTWLNHMLGAPQPEASTYAFADVEPSSTSEPSAAAQKRARTSASEQSQVAVLIIDGTAEC